MVSIIPFIRLRSDFDDEVTRIMGEAFDAAYKDVGDTGWPSIVHIDPAKAGERDPIRLRDIAVAAVGKTTSLD